MKVVSAKQMQQIELEAYRDGASESDFMEEAGSGVGLLVHDFAEKYHLDKQVILLCGKGNNAGDAYVAGIHLLHLDYKVLAYQAFPIDECSNLCRQNYARFINDGGFVEENFTMERVIFPPHSVIVDGLFGTGFHGNVEEPVASLIRAANKSQIPIIAVDIPSGLNGETGQASTDSIIATFTAFLGLPKSGFFLRDGWNHVGFLHYIDFGLDQQYIQATEAEMIMLEHDVVLPLRPKMKRNRNKYEAGYVVGLAGSPDMPGAALLSSLAALRGGAGIVRLLHPEGMNEILASSPYELIKTPYSKGDVEKIIETMNRAAAVFIGPGIGLKPETKQLLCDVLPRITVPCVIDADALTILAEYDFKLPEKTVLTPHHGELKRLMKVDNTDLTIEFLWQCNAYAAQKNVTLVVKGGPTFIFHPDSPIAVSPKGDPGMATAGSGDVLTGLIAALLAQGLSPKDAAYLGVYMHGIAGEIAAEDMTSYCMIASDIINFFPDAYDPTNW